MWTARIFFGIALAAIGFLFWFLFGLIREEIRYPRRRFMPTVIIRPRTGPLNLENGSIRRESQSVTVRLVWRYGAGSNEGESSCETWSS